MSIDYADYLTEKRLKALENKLKKEYKKAYEEMQDTWDQYINGYDEIVLDKDKNAKIVHHKSLQERYDEELEKFQSGQSGYKDQTEFNAWYQTQIQRGLGYQKTVDELALEMVNANQRASAYINNDAYSIYALNANFQAYQISKDYDGVSFRLYSEDTVKELVTEGNYVEFRTTSVNPQRDYAWNRDKITSALLSGILQGKSIDRIADSFYTVMGRNRSSAIRNARTAYTSAQNGGRQATAERAQKMGIKSQKQWLAIGDERTRFSHAMLNGQIRDIDKVFSNGLMYPADPSGSPAEVYNCRCKRLYVLPKYENKISNETYDQWQNMSPEEQKAEKDAYNKWVKDQQAKKSLGDGTYKKSGYDFNNFGSAYKTQKNSFIEAKTIRQAEEYAKNVLGIQKVIYKGVDVDIANEMNKSFTDLLNSTEKAKDKLKAVGNAQEINKALKTDLIIAFKEDLKRLYPSLSDDKMDYFANKFSSQWVGRLKGNTIAHARGEIYDATYTKASQVYNEYVGVSINQKYANNLEKLNRLAKGNSASGFHPEGATSARSFFDHECGHIIDYVYDLRNNKEIKAIIKSYTKAQIKTGLSKYALDNDAETIAEAYAEYKNSNKPREIASKLGKKIDEIREKNG